ncbi:MAG: flagellar hook-basal body complex protein FliE [Lachnospiraceae bacterium]|jgi:flagellar hook-basal body complex protein FliE|nr:flagellar hook-basal body complex protein FliE [Lachnospiraceae bacterium]MCR4779080.1 flagellar hook-basal body complex protein FliE [Lachnospiraceae bacterium]
MDISSIIPAVKGVEKSSASIKGIVNPDQGKNVSFDSLFTSALNMLEETNALTNMAQEEAINFSMGYTDNIHDLMVAQQKANLSLQYTVAVRNAVVDAYKEIMNLQF